YEIHHEKNFGVRTYAGIKNQQKADLNWELNAGLEYQQNASEIANYGNRAGVRDTLQAADHIRTAQHFYFTQLTLNYKRLIFESAVSLNFYRYAFSKPAIAEIRNYTPGSVSFDPQLMPRFALSYKLSDYVALRSTISRGYSPPATAEVRASDNRLNTSLEPEKGWNYEAGVRLYSKRERFTLDASAYYYRLSQAIVRRLNNNGTEFFVNAGGTRQPGIELAATGWLIEQKATGAIRGLQLQHSLNLTRYRFTNYVTGNTDFSSKQLTGTPAKVFVTGLYVLGPQNLSLFLLHNFTGKIPLNDANTAYADAYHYVTGKLSYVAHIGKTEGQIYVGIDNLLDQKFSLGNDLNAFGNRFYNAAAPRNWFAGMKISL
ncbi:MAG: TonB-dependent receptor, partial [Mucilaginibacter polytrichastri]|nr:TonB-dependent receptor [Mucilaginibacter polytrichastri]